MSDSPKWYNNMEKFTLNGQDKKDLNVILERMEQADNSQFRQDTKKWRGVIGAGFVGLFFKQMYDLFT